MSSLGGYRSTNEAGVISAIYDWYGRKQARREAGSVPRNYVAFDLETLGAKRSEDLVTMIGVCVVEDGEPQFYEGRALNWYDYEGTTDDGQLVIDRDWLHGRLMRLSYQMRDWHGITVETMRERGKDPIETLDWCLDLFDTYRAKGASFAAHNMLRTDEPLIKQAFSEFLGAQWEFQDHELLDTAAVEKAAALGLKPMQVEGVREYYKRILGTRSKVKYSMDHCIEKYAMKTSYDLDLSRRHLADTDSLLVHYLVEEHRELITGK